LSPIALFLSVTESAAFGIHRPASHGTIIPSNVNHHALSSSLSWSYRQIMRSHQAKIKDDSDDDGLPNGMEAAFRELDSLESLGEGGSGAFLQGKIQKDEAFAKAMAALDLQDVVDAPPLTPEKEVQLYTDMITEMETTDAAELISTVKSDMGGGSSVTQSITIPEFDPKILQTDDFMKKALEEALAEAKKQGKVEINTKSILDDKEIMKEIRVIFDKANDKLVASLEEIRTDQVRYYLYESSL
jgi:hypothetical protein